ncbi:glycosyltransferase [Methyloversatilis sp. XJ19-13]|uniref:glycosyltransferase family 2 protein n=1 Tax=Methyloversatilis sp. XJ19-13 TaxID=2963430 RepID=UPI00211CC931|nr:glycosyltransferase [Methyloversatilis sp. XJ19-13]
MNPTLSVLVATHNRPVLLVEALDSVVAQTESDWEIVLVDDGSTPAVDAEAMTARYGSRIQVLRHDAPRGSAASRNTAIRHARGRILAFLDDDDLLAPRFLAAARSALDRYPTLDLVCLGVSWFGKHADASRADFVSSTQRFLDEAGGVVLEPGVREFGAALLPAILRRVPMALQQQVLRTEAAARLGEFREGRILDRSDWAIRAALYLRVGLIEEGLYLQRCDGQSYASRSDRFVEFLWAGVDLIERLIQRAKTESHAQDRMDILHVAAAKSWFDLAYELAQRGEVATPFKAWLNSQRHHFSVQRLRFIGRLGLNLLGLGRRSA